MKIHAIVIFLLCAIFSDHGNCIRSTQRRLRTCRVLCMVVDTIGRNNQQTCLVLRDQNITITECVSNCIRMKGEQLRNTTECQCINGKCIEQPTSTSVTNSTTSVSTVTTILPSTNSTLSPNATTTSTTTTTRPPPERRTQ